MSNKVKIGFSLAVLFVLFAGLYAHFHHPQTLVGSLPSGTDVGTTNFNSISVANGESNGGLWTTASRIAMGSATTTVCAIQSPNATSSLTLGSAFFSVSSTTATTVSLAKATTAFATTTSLGSAALAANAQGTVFASTTPSQVTVDGAQIFAPNTWFVVGIAGGTGGAFSPTGICVAEFQVLQ